MASPSSLQFKLLIDGNLVAGEGSPFPVINPSNGQLFADCPQATREQVDAAVAAASTALKSWSVSLDKRRSCFLKAHAVLQPHIAALAQILHTEQGKPLSAAIDEARYAIEMFNSATSAELSEGLQLMQGGGFEGLQQLRRALHYGTCSASTAPPNEPRVSCTWFRIVRKPRVDRRKMCADSFANSLIALSG